MDSPQRIHGLSVHGQHMGHPGLSIDCPWIEAMGQPWVTHGSPMDSPWRPVKSFRAALAGPGSTKNIVGLDLGCYCEVFCVDFVVIDLGMLWDHPGPT